MRRIKRKNPFATELPEVAVTLIKQQMIIEKLKQENQALHSQVEQLQKDYVEAQATINKRTESIITMLENGTK